MSSKILKEPIGTFQAIFDDENFTQVAIIAAVGFVLFTILIVLLLRGRKSKKRTILLTGVSDAGKTALFTKLIFGKEAVTYTSIKENSGLYFVKAKGKDVPLVDIPGNERQRLQLWEKFKEETRGLIFVVDSSRFQKEVKEVAEFLYILLTDPVVHRSKLRLLVVCNKQDVALAKSSKVIQSQLEKELNTLRVTRAATLDSTDTSGQTKEYFLGKEGKNFEFSQLSPMKVEFTECICKGSEEKATDVESIEEWIKKVAK